jgi:hypothetical protein
MFTKNEWLLDRPFFNHIIDRKDLTIIEIGVESGKNAFCMLNYLDIKELILIDPFIEYGDMLGDGVLAAKDGIRCKDEAFKLLEPYESKITWILDLSENVASQIKDNSIDVCYVDGNHRFEYVKKDLELYWPKIKVGGYLSGHDYKNEYACECEVRKAVMTFSINKQIGFHHNNWDFFFEKK